MESEKGIKQLQPFGFTRSVDSGDTFNNQILYRCYNYSSNQLKRRICIHSLIICNFHRLLLHILETHNWKAASNEHDYFG